MSDADPILAARVDALHQNLDRVRASLELVDRLAPGDTIMPEDLRNKVRWQVELLVNDWGNELGQIRDVLANGSSAEQLCGAWSRYQQLQDQSQELFAGCLELIGGCAFRQNLNNENEKQVWAIADRLIVDAAVDLNGSPGDPYLAIPALQEALSISSVRTVRLRFPEWTVWSLPLLAYDLGHVAITDYRIQLEKSKTPLQDVLDAQTQAELDHDEQHQQELKAGASNEAKERQIRRAGKWARHRLRVLLADALATHWMGPAYVCAAVRLRFDPASAFSSRPSYDERLRFVITRLRDVASRSEETDVVTKLESEWNDAVERADPPRPAGPPSPTPDDDLISTFNEVINALPATFGFDKLRWQKVGLAETTWEQQGKQRKKLEPPEIKLALREVLNAAWLTRLASPELADQIASVAVATWLAQEKLA